MKIIYINYVDFNDVSSGSTVRPKKIYEAFLESNYDVYMLTGSILKTNRKNRVENINKIEKYLNDVKFDFCYIESPSNYIVFKEDRDLIKKISKKNIPIGYFYRDIYYKFANEIIFQNGKKNIFSKEYLKFLYKRIRICFDEKLIKKYVNVVFVPSQEMMKYLKFSKMISLPPAGEFKKNLNNLNREGVIYVGGLSERYGTNYMLKALEYINNELDEKINLTIICREKEKSFIDKKYLNRNWLKIIHCSGDELEKYYNNAKLALIPQQKCNYNDFAVSVKIYEYMSYNLPIVATDCDALKRIISNLNVGMVASALNYKDFANKILELYNNLEQINIFKKNIKNSLINENLWIHRIETIRKNLGSDNDER